MTASNGSDETDRRQRALVVEDEMMISLAIEDTLISMGHVVIGPFGRVDAALAVSEQLIDFAMLDVNVDGQTVFPVARALKRRGIPFVFLTGSELINLPEEWQTTPVLEKPFSERDLRKAAETLARSAK